jgi:hypothetical protein
MQSTKNESILHMMRTSGKEPACLRKVRIAVALNRISEYEID